MNLNDYMKSTNGPAYEKNESGSGPPLTYIGEKLRGALKQSHAVLSNLQSCVPDDLPLPSDYCEDAPISAKNDLLISPAFTAFHYQAVAFAALFNMLSLVSARKGVERLIGMSEAEFENGSIS